MSHYHKGFEDGAAVGRSKVIDERLARGGTERMENQALEDLFAEKMGQIRPLLTPYTNGGLIGQVADILTAAMNAAYRMDRD